MGVVTGCGQKFLKFTTDDPIIYLLKMSVLSYTRLCDLYLISLHPLQKVRESNNEDNIRPPIISNPNNNLGC
jgi:hypothetical protein